MPSPVPTFLVGTGSAPGHPLLHSSSRNSLNNLDAPYHTPLRMEHMQFFRQGLEMAGVILFVTQFLQLNLFFKQGKKHDCTCSGALGTQGR